MANFYGEHEHVNSLPCSDISIRMSGSIGGSVMPYMREKGIGLLREFAPATLSQRAYAIDNPDSSSTTARTYGGLTACGRPTRRNIADRWDQPEFHTYHARGAVTARSAYDGNDVAATAAVASIAYTPELPRRDWRK